MRFFLHKKSTANHCNTRQRGFTLIELLIVVAIAGVLLSVIVINMGSATSISVSMATQDSLRIIRYARNMALQTQQPINVLFTQGRIEIIPTELKNITISATTNKDETLTQKETFNEEETKSTSFLDPNRLEGKGFDEIALVKYYQNVNFKFLSYDDNVNSFHRNGKKEHNTFERRIDLDGTPNKVDEEGNTSFTLTIRANGTMRPCTFQVYACDEEGDGDHTGGNTVSFDFLCTGKIADDE